MESVLLNIVRKQYKYSALAVYGNTVIVERAPTPLICFSTTFVVVVVVVCNVRSLTAVPAIAAVTTFDLRRAWIACEHPFSYLSLVVVRNKVQRAVLVIQHVL